MIKIRKKRSIIWVLDRDRLADIVSKSTTLGQILKHFDLKNDGGRVNTLKRRLDEEKIDYSHIPLGMGCNRGRNVKIGTGIPLEIMLTENSNRSRQNLKRRLLAEEILENVCSECGQDSEWQGKPLVMVLDHINGINNDNRLENLRMLCPNCNSQTETFSGRNVKKIIRNCVREA